MFLEMTCNCLATFQVDAEPEDITTVWLMATRFSNAHINCGFMTNVVMDEPEKTKRYEITERLKENE